MSQEAVAFVFLASFLVYVVASVGLVPLGWAFVSLVLTPLLALIALTALPPGTNGDPASPFEAELRSR
jgi:hypothetical protein